MSLIIGLHHVCMKCPGLEAFDRTIQFYTEVLGMTEVRRWNTGVNSAITLDTGNGGLIELFANGDGNTETGSIKHFALLVNDAEACAEKVRALGYKITIEPKNVDLSNDAEHSYPVRVAFCVGPMGEEIEFFQER